MKENTCYLSVNEVMEGLSRSLANIQVNIDSYRLNYPNNQRPMVLACLWKRELQIKNDLRMMREVLMRSEKQEEVPIFNPKIHFKI